MKVIIAGSRNFYDRIIIERAIEYSKFTITELVCGKCSGVDSVGEEWGKNNDIHVEPFPADWDTYGNAAGPIRNEQMAKYADALILVWDGKSRGSASMLRLAKKHNLNISQYMI